MIKASHSELGDLGSILMSAETLCNPLAIFGTELVSALTHVLFILLCSL